MIVATSITRQDQEKELFSSNPTLLLQELSAENRRAGPMTTVSGGCPIGDVRVVAVHVDFNIPRKSDTVRGIRLKVAKDCSVFLN